MDNATEESLRDQGVLPPWTIWVIVTGVTGGLCILLAVTYALLYFFKIKPHEKRMARRMDNENSYYFSENMIPLDTQKKHQFTYNWLWYHGRPPEERQGMGRKVKVPRFKKRSKSKRLHQESLAEDSELD